MAGSTTFAGSLTRAEQLRFAREAVKAQIQSLPGAIRARLGRAADSALARDAVPPDTALARDALKFVAEVYPASLQHHCMRCWYFGDFFAQLDGHIYDPELLFVACLFHDIALSERYRDRRLYACFACEGGEVAQSWLTSHGAQPQFSGAVASAIAQHMDVHAPASNTSIEAYLLHEAAHLDVAGTRADEVSPAYARTVTQRHPRDGFARVFSDAMKHESIRRRSSRASVLWKIGMRIPIHTNPLDAATRHY